MTMRIYRFLKSLKALLTDLVFVNPAGYCRIHRTISAIHFVKVMVIMPSTMARTAIDITATAAFSSLSPWLA